MANFYLRRPMTTAVRLLPENYREIVELTGHEVAFAAKTCFLKMEDKIEHCPIGDWLFRDNSNNLITLPPYIFNQEFEPVPEEENHG